MTLDSLVKRRRLVPYVVAVVCLVPWLRVILGEPGPDLVLLFVAALPAAFVVAFFYVGMDLRGFFWAHENDRHVGQLIRAEILGLIPDHLSVNPLERQALREWVVFKSLTGVFWEAIDRDEQLKALKPHFYANGLRYTTSFDVLSLCGFSSYCYLVAFLFARDSTFGIGAAVLFLLALGSRLLVTPRARREHLDLSRQQLDLLRRNQRDFVGQRIGDIVAEWRSGDGIPTPSRPSRWRVLGPAVLGVVALSLLPASWLAGQRKPEPEVAGSGADPRALEATGEQLEAALGAAEFHALLIAVQDYGHDSVTDLDQPIADARRLEEILVRRYEFKPELVKRLENPNEELLLGALLALKQTLDGNDSLLLFFAGHGYWDDDIRQGYWLPADARQDSRAKWISNSDIRDAISALKTRHTLLISDACFSGGLFKERTAFSEADRAIEELYESPSRKAMTSGTLDKVPDKSVFLEYLTNRLIENRKRYLTADQLFASLREAVINNSSTKPQYGVIQTAGDEGGEFVFSLRQTTGGS